MDAFSFKSIIVLSNKALVFRLRVAKLVLLGTPMKHIQKILHDTFNQFDGNCIIFCCRKSGVYLSRGTSTMLQKLHTGQSKRQTLFLGKVVVGSTTLDQFMDDDN